MTSPRPTEWKRPFTDRLLGALRLDQSVFAEVARDPDAMGQAAAVVALGALAQGIGGVQATSTSELILGIAAMVLSGFFGWIVSTAVIWLVGVGLLGARAEYPDLLRTLGFTNAPKLLWLLGALPLGPALFAAIGLTIFVWTIAALVLGVRQALGVTTGRAVLVCVLGMIAGLVLALVMGAMIGLGAGLVR
ncbi:MAG TPA: YIP1 family protein [Candidatus Binatia bacterium]